MTKYIIVIFLCLFIAFPASGQVKTDNFSSEDRKVLTDLQVNVAQLNVKLDEYQKQTQLQFVHVQKQFDSLQNQLDNHQTFLYWGFGILISFMGFILGFVLWDRRTTLAPVVKEAEELKRRENKILDILRAYSEKEPKLRELLKNAGML
jgi:predicted PurR-regulated permease PerM